MEVEQEILVMKNISKKYPGVQALDDVSFTLLAGEIHALVGANGAGKSTLVGILSGARTKDSGSIFVNGEEVNITDPLSAIEMGIGYVPQELVLCEKLSIAENIYLNRQPRYKEHLPITNTNEMFQEAKKVMDQLGIDADVRAPVGDFPVSTQQMVMLGMALSRNALIMVLDETTASLTSKEIQSLFEVMKKLRDAGHALVYISHRLEEVFEIADRCTVLRDGKSLGTFQVKKVTRDMLVNLITGKILTTEVNTRVLDPNVAKKLSVKGLFVPNKLHGISFDLKRGEVLGLFGQVGSGRTEVLRSIFGLEDIAQGEIWIDGKAYTAKSPSVAIDHEIGFLTEDRKNQGLVLNLPIVDNFLMGVWEIVKSGL